MVDFTPVLTKAVAGKATYEERRLVYEKARAALLGQLRAISPPLPEADITKQRLALEEAIRKVEIDASGIAVIKSPADETKPAPAPVAAPVAPAPVPAVAASVSSPLNQTIREAGVLGQASAIAAREARDALSNEDVIAAPAADVRVEPSLTSPVDAAPVADAAPVLSESEPSDDDGVIRPRLMPVGDDVDLGAGRRKWVMGGIAALLVLVLAGGFTLLKPLLGGSNVPVVSNGATTPAAGSGKIVDRMQQEGGGDAASSGAPAAVVNQAAFLYEENVDTTKGTDAFRGKVTWRLDTDSSRPGQGPEKVIQGLVEVPERGIKMLLTIRRNTDTALPASHTVELLFDVAPDFVHGSVESVAGIRMKPSDQANGLPLVGASARITAGYFLIGLSSLGPDRERNVVLLRDRPWIDVPVLYRNGRRAVIALEKGIPGEKVFQEAFGSWGNN